MDKIMYCQHYLHQVGTIVRDLCTIVIKVQIEGCHIKEGEGKQNHLPPNTSPIISNFMFFWCVFQKIEKPGSSVFFLSKFFPHVSVFSSTPKSFTSGKRIFWHQVIRRELGPYVRIYSTTLPWYSSPLLNPNFLPLA